jgi:hypothetical protein
MYRLATDETAFELENDKVAVAVEGIQVSFGLVLPLAKYRHQWCILK